MKAYGIYVNLSGPIVNVATPQPTSKNFSPSICPDQHVGSMTLINGNWQLSNSLILSRNTPGANPYNIDYGTKANGDYILLILESPHIDEFESATRLPFGPACGKKSGSAGYDIDFWIDNVFMNSPKFRSGLHKDSYQLILMNSVQFQASCGTSPLLKKLRDSNWVTMWQNGFSKDLINRIRWYSTSNENGEVIVVNLCTFGNVGLHYYVNSELRNNGISFYEGFHPAFNWLQKKRRVIF